MARARNIKPGFFKNDTLAEVPPLGRILFAGLWTIADREGRLEDRPKRIKAEILPYDDCDVDELLSELSGRGFITRYFAGTSTFIQITNWKKHQDPHVKEAASTIPAPDEHGASAVLAPDKPVTSTEVAPLIPSSLIPDSLFSDSQSPVQAPDVVRVASKQRKPASSGAVALFVKAYSEEYGHAPHVDTASAANLCSCLRTVPQNEWEGLIRAYVRDEEQWLRDRAHALQHFPKQLDRLRATVAGKLQAATPKGHARPLATAKDFETFPPGFLVRREEA